jgi:hypothetical protein
MTGEGTAEWLAAAPEVLAASLDLDYERYARAEAELGWANGRVHVKSTSPLSVRAIFERFLGELESLPVTHIKLTALDASGASRGSASLLRRGGRAAIDARQLLEDQAEVVLVVNARAALAPAELEKSLRRAMSVATDGAPHEWEVFACFSPPPPVPTHRHVTRCSAQGDACCP